MAQVADPQDHTSTNPGTDINADDMLAQLAGSEIDRLLAEADVAKSNEPAPTASPASAALTAPAIPRDPREIAAVETELGLDEAALTSQLDELFNQLQEETAAKVAQIAPAAQPAAEPSPPADAAPIEGTQATVEAPPTEAAAQAPAPETTLTEGAERAALLEAAGFESNPDQPQPVEKEIAPAPAAQIPPIAAAAPPPAPNAKAEPIAPAQTSAEDSERSAVLSAAGFESAESVESKAGMIPIWIKPLIWINRPIEHCSPAIRQAMGRAAIVTLVNALLVLSYLAITHTHHH
jgi:hypothetical protein